MSQARYIPKIASTCPTAPFTSAEQAWFWFVRCQQLRREGARFRDSRSGFARPCDPDDIYRVVTRLARHGFLRTQHLSVLARFGEHGRPPDTRCGEEAASARLWDEALDRLTTALAAKGIVA